MEELDRKFIELYEEIGKSQGLGDSLMMDIFARLYLEPGEVAMEDIAKETGYSLASISNNLKVLSSIVPVKRVRKPGTKKLFLSVEKDFLKIATDQIQKKDASMRLVMEKVPQLVKEFKPKAKSEKDKKKIEILEDYYRQVKKFSNVMEEISKKLLENRA